MLALFWPTTLSPGRDTVLARVPGSKSQNCDGIGMEVQAHLLAKLYNTPPSPHEQNPQRATCTSHMRMECDSGSGTVPPPTVRRSNPSLWPKTAPNERVRHALWGTWGTQDALGTSCYPAQGTLPPGSLHPSRADCALGGSIQVETGGEKVFKRPIGVAPFFGKGNF